MLLPVLSYTPLDRLGFAGLLDQFAALLAQFAELLAQLAELLFQFAGLLFQSTAAADVLIMAAMMMDANFISVSLCCGW